MHENIFRCMLSEQTFSKIGGTLTAGWDIL